MWHTSIRNHATDRHLTDAEWAYVAREVMNAVGLAPNSDPNAVRWAAVRHAEDHIHIVATLVHQDGATAWGWNERYKAQAAARRLERELGLYRVGPVDRTAHRYPGATEQNKTRRLGHREVARDRLRREVRAAAAATSSEDEFFQHLRSAGILVRPRHRSIDPAEVTGYSVGLPGNRASNGDTIWYGGGRLAPDLTLPRLRRRWGRPSGSRAMRRGNALSGARDAVRSAAERMAALAGDDPERAAGIAVHASDVLVALARASGRGRLSQACDRFDHAARPGGRQTVAHTLAGNSLRASARLIAALNHVDEKLLLDLIRVLARFADTLAAVRHAQDRLHQARSALAAAAELRTFASQLASSRPQQIPLPLHVDQPASAVGRHRSRR